eukprot:TRINITY_DN7005_c0_g1_i1.p1 TRINITY_DN7005_c0_g1~~TRINITY_DN7005_c0_g1_i1.p1  ORF type:complete len:304 (-),score=54.82 TRINITY_DN7005_c0_g1_i1:18-929(-)
MGVYLLFVFLILIHFSACLSTDENDMAKLEGSTVILTSMDNSGNLMGKKQIYVDSFAIDKTTVTNKQFREFVRVTKYKTQAEGPPPSFGWSFVFDYQLPDSIRNHPSTRAVPSAPHWLAVQYANWRKPEGPGSGINKKLNHPVVHVSWEDASSYCKWKGKRLPTEAEWYYAGVGNNKKFTPFPWGEKPRAGNYNIWQGKFPTENTKEDGYIFTAPVNAYEPNALGIYNMIGNVWEWCQDDYPTQPGEETKKVMRGGSWIDSIDGSFNHMASLFTSMGNTPDSSANNVGFRCAKSIILTDKEEL